jgi:hypothetical protein
MICSPFGQNKSSFCHNLNYASNQKASFTKVVQFGSWIKGMSSEVDDMHFFGHKSSFRNNLNYASNQRVSFTKVVEFGLLHQLNVIRS